MNSDFDGRLLQEAMRLSVDEYQAPKDLLSGVVDRYRSHRRHTAAASAVAAITVIAALFVPTMLTLRPDDHGGPPLSAATPPPSPSVAPSPTSLPSSVSSPIDLNGPARVVPLSEAFPGRSPITIDRALGDGRKLTAQALTDDGRILGVSEVLDENFFNTWAEGLLLFDPRTRQTTSITAVQQGYWPGPRQLGAFIPWLGHVVPTHKFDLMCRDLRIGTDTQVSDGSVWESTVRLSGPYMAWTYYPGTGEDRLRVAVADGCGGPTQNLAVEGAVLDFHGSYVYVAERKAGWIASPPAEVNVVRVNVLTGTTEQVGRIGPTDDESFAFAATSRASAWLAERNLMVRDLSTGRTATVVRQLPKAPGVNGEILDLTAGDTVFAYGTSPSDGDPATARGLVYDPTRNVIVELPGEALANGRWLLWRDGDTYQLLDLG